MEKKSSVLRVPEELVRRINQYESTLAKNNIRMSKVDVMRNFAENAITPLDNVGTFLSVLNKASNKK